MENLTESQSKYLLTDEDIKELTETRLVNKCLLCGKPLGYIHFSYCIDCIDYDFD